MIVSKAFREIENPAGFAADHSGTSGFFFCGIIELPV
jgi:hypothetical protein